uniref:Uncharacterized protein n=1 Tax=Anguilla anguilla TaxID=7936 RepID=A0A0E9PNQ5_ANGAN
MSTLTLAGILIGNVTNIRLPFFPTAVSRITDFS